ncbi:MAG: hypothetical protein ACYTG0_24610 [Planctomycetota bacterium]|jgi:hypothetical protein
MSTPSPVGEIRAGVCCPLSQLKERIGVDAWAWREIMKDGFQPVKIGRRKFVLGDDWLRYVRDRAERQCENGEL